MSAIKATVRNGRVETERPLDLPDGTEVLLYPSTDKTPVDDDNDDDDNDDGFWDDTPEGIAAWLRAYDALEPLILTDEERAAIDKARAEQRAWELEHFEERAEKLRKMWE